MTGAQNIDQILKDRRIIVTCGTGGVGKTTLSAALAMRAAIQGRRAVVVTVDPAKRLATALGLQKLGNEAADLTGRLAEAARRAKAAGLPAPDEVRGKLFAIMPDIKHTFEELLAELAPSPAVVDRILANPIVEIFSKEFSGANEYMAMERLQALARDDRFDCIILDTPPSRNTLAFLEAPKLMAQLFEERLIRWLVLPTNKLVSGGMKKALGVLEKLTGAGFMTSLFDFGSSLFEVRVRFQANLTRTVGLLESAQVGFIMVATPTPETGPEVAHFIESVRAHHFHFDGVALNRSLSYLGANTTSPLPGPGAPQSALELIQGLQVREELAIKGITERGIPICAKLPELARDVHSVEDLFHVAMAFNPGTAF